MDVLKNIALLSSWIDEAKTITTVCHSRPDGDAAGSSAAMAWYLRDCRDKDVVSLVPDPVPDNVRFVLEGLDCRSGSASIRDRLSRSNLIICLDFNTFSRVEGFEEMLRESPARKVLIDHHEEPDTAAFGICISDTGVSSACELLYRVLLAMPGIDGDATRLPSAALRALMTGMTTDTNNFSNSVYPGTLGMASDLLDAGVDRDDIIDRLYHSERPNRLSAMGEMLSSRMVLLPCGAAVTVLPMSFYERHSLLDGETEGFVNLPLTLKDIRLSVLAKEDGGVFRISIRSKKGVSARMLAKHFFHGGGHEQASGGKILMPQDISAASEAEAYVCDITARFMQDQAGLE